MDGGKCGTHTYHGYDQEKINNVIAELKANGCTVTGNNPWDVDTHRYGVKLRGQWDEASGVLSVIVTDKKWYVPCSKIWDFIDPLLAHVGTLSAAEMQ